MSDELMYSGKFLNYYKRGRWEFVSRANAHAVVAIAALTDNQEIVLIEQVREPLGESGELVIEIPAGLVGDDRDEDGNSDDSILAAARRELIEECGFDAEELWLTGTGPSSAGLSDEIISMVCAKGLTKVAEGGGIGDEDISTQLIPVRDVRAYLANKEADGILVDPKVYAALFLLDLGI